MNDMDYLNEIVVAEKNLFLNYIGLNEMGVGREQVSFLFGILKI